MNKAMKYGWLCSAFATLFCLPPLSAEAKRVAGVSAAAVVDSQAEATRLLQEGEALAKEGKLLSAVSTFTRALSLMEGFSEEHPLRLGIERQLRIAKGRVLVARYKGRDPNAPVARPLSPKPPPPEPDEVRVAQVFGTVLLRAGDWGERYIENTDDTFAFGRRITVSPGAGVEMMPRGASGFSLRAVETASFSFLRDSHLRVHSGAYALRAAEDDAKFKVDGPFASFEITSDDPFAVMFGVTTNGGMKIIGLVGDAELRRPGEEPVSLRPGQLLFVLPKGYSRKMYVELSTLITTARLLTAFDEPPAYYKRLKTEALAQALRTKRRFRTIVGDVKGTDSFEVKVLREDELPDK